MPRGDKSSKAKRKRQVRAIEEGNESKGVARTEGNARAWAAVNKLPGEGMKVASRRKLPSGPLGGSGRKTNRARSS